jgi:predicted secreted hydrolase
MGLVLAASELGEKLMLFRLRQTDGQQLLFRQLDRARRQAPEDRVRRYRHDAEASTEIEGRKMPTQWRIAIPARR